MKSIVEELILGKVIRGDWVLLEYDPVYPMEGFAWGILMPALLERGNVVVADFFGVGDLLFRNYLRRVTGEEYSRAVDLFGRIRVFKIGPGMASYGEIVEEITPSYDPGAFLRNYHTIVSRMSRLPMKPDYFVTFGLGHYIHFGRDEALKSLLTAISTIPMEDWVGIHFVNTGVLDGHALSVIEGVTPFVIHLSTEGIRLRKEGGTVDI